MKAQTAAEIGTVLAVAAGLTAIVLNKETRTAAVDTAITIGRHARTAGLNIAQRSLHAVGPIVAEETGSFVQNAGTEVSTLVAGVADRVADVAGLIARRRERTVDAA